MVKKVLKNRDISKKLNLEDEVKKRPSASKVSFVSDSSGVINKKVLDAKTKAQTVIDDANVDAEKIRSDAGMILKQVEEEFEKNKKEGFSQGRDEGFSSVTEQVMAFEKMKEDFYEKAEENIIRLVTQVAEKVIGKIVQENGEAIKAIVKQAIESSLGDRILIRVSPEDYKTVSAAESEFRDILDRTKRLTFKEDESIAQGGCVVETEVGTIDARLETQLKAIKKALEL